MTRLKFAIDMIVAFAIVAAITIAFSYVRENRYEKQCNEAKGKWVSAGEFCIIYQDNRV